MSNFLQKIILFISILAVGAGLSGCADKILFPEASFTVASVEPNELRVEAAVESDTNIVLPPTSISIISESKIPANLEAFSISYTTRLGEPIPQIAVPETKQNLQLLPEATTEVSINPYTRRLYDLFSLTNADISPVNALMYLKIKDINGNTVHVEASCLCYASWD